MVRTHKNHHTADSSYNDDSSDKTLTKSNINNVDQSQQLDIASNINTNKSQLLPRQYGAFLFIVVQYGVFPPFSSVSCRTGWGLSLLSDGLITNMGFLFMKGI